MDRTARERRRRSSAPRTRSARLQGGRAHARAAARAPRVHERPALHPGEEPLRRPEAPPAAAAHPADEPNVLILDEPTNDLDTDMLAAIEDLLDSWPGTLLVVSHDRYLVERVTDRQFAILDGHLRDLPRGVDQYLELRRQQADAGGGAPRPRRHVRSRRAVPRLRRPRWPAQGAASTSGGGCRGIRCPHRRGATCRREGALVDRPQAREAAGADRGAAREARAPRPGRLRRARTRSATSCGGLEASVAELETRWLEVSEALEG